jgi:hypothetical protein
MAGGSSVSSRSSIDAAAESGLSGNPLIPDPIIVIIGTDYVGLERPETRRSSLTMSCLGSGYTSIGRLLAVPPVFTRTLLRA